MRACFGHWDVTGGEDLRWKTLAKEIHEEMAKRFPVRQEQVQEFDGKLEKNGVLEAITEAQNQMFELLGLQQHYSKEAVRLKMHHYFSNDSCSLVFAAAECVGRISCICCSTPKMI